jgi:hypothetical protein
MKLWGDVKFFDPQIASGAVDWDAAFMNAEPAILAATSRESYSSAIAGLLAPLHDPASPGVLWRTLAETPPGETHIATPFLPIFAMLLV